MSSAMISEYLLYDSQWSIVICKRCKYALEPGSGVEKHLGRKHTAIDLDIRKGLIAWARNLTLVEPVFVGVPDENTLPIAGLELIKHGFKCDNDECLEYYATT